MRAKAEKSDAEAQSNLGRMYGKGVGLRMDYDEAVKWFRKVAEQGHPLAQYNLGVMGEHGHAVPQDNVEAVKWYRKAADQGLPLAQFNFGGAFYEGRGVAHNDTEAYKWWLLASAQGHEEATKNIPIIKPKNVNGRGENRGYAFRRKHFRNSGLSPERFIAEQWEFHCVEALRSRSGFSLPCLG